VLAVELLDQGAYYKQGSSIEQVHVSYGGTYWRTDGANGWNVRNGGNYYREDASVAPYVADVTVTVTDAPPSAGAGASLSVEIDEDTASETFGQVVSLSIDNGGDGYLAHETFESCFNRYNGRSIVVRRLYNYWSIYPFFPNPQWPFDKCIYGYTCAPIDDCSLEAEAVMVEYRGNGDPNLQLPGGWRVGLYLQQGGPAAYGNFVAPENVQDCSDIDITANGLPDSNTDGATAHIQGGGEYEEVDACKRISAEDMDAMFTEVTWGDFSSSSLAGGFGPDFVHDNGCGWTSRVLVVGNLIDTTGQWCEDWQESAGGTCFEYHRVPHFSAGIVRTGSCGLRWGGGGLTNSFVCGLIERMVGFGSNINNQYRVCSWCYPVLSVEHDEETLLPVSVELGDAVFTTFGPAPEWSAERDPEGKYLSEAAVCQDPGKPTITLSVLP
jgi:hypothetical protein